MTRPIDGYGLNNLVHHCLRAGRRQFLFELIENPAWHAQKVRYDPSRFLLANDIAQCIGVLHGRADLSQLLAYSFLFSMQGGLAAAMSPEALALMVAVGEGEHAVRLANQYTHPVERVEALGRVVEEFARLQHHRLAQATARTAYQAALDLPEIEYRDRALVLAVTASARAQDLPLALTAVAHIQNPILKDQALGRIAISALRIGEFERAVSLGQTLEHIPTQVLVWAEGLHLNELRGDPEWERRLRAGLQTSLARFAPQDYGIEFNVSIVRNLLNVGMLEKAMELARQTLDGHWLIRGLRNLWDAHLAYRLYRAMPPAEARLGEPSDLAKILASAGRLEEALEIARGLSEDLRGKSGVFAAIVWALAEQSAFEEAERLCTAITQVEIRNWALAGLGQFLASSGDLPGARNILDRIQGSLEVDTALDFAGFKTRAGLGFAIATRQPNLLVEVGRGRLAEAFLLELIDICLERAEWSLSAALIAALPEGQSTDGQRMKWFKLQTDQESYPRLLRALHALPAKLQAGASLLLIQRYLRDGANRKAVYLTARLKPGRPRDEAYRMLARQHGQHGRFRCARTWIRKIRSETIRSRANLEFVLALAEAGQVRRAWRALRLLSQTSDRQEALAILFQYVSEQSPRKARLILREIRDSHHALVPFVWLATRHLLAGRQTALAAILQAVPESKRANLWVGVAASCLEADREEVLEKIEAQVSERTANVIRGMTFRRALAHGDLAGVYDRLGRVTSRRQQHVLLREIIENLSAQGRFSEALEVLRKSIVPSGQNDILKLITLGLVARDQFEQAIGLTEQIQSALLRRQLRRRIVLSALLARPDDQDRFIDLLYLVFQNMRSHGRDEMLAGLEDAAPALGAVFADVELDQLIAKFHQMQALSHSSVVLGEA